MTYGHERFDFKAMPPRDFHTASVFLSSGAFVDIFQNPWTSRFEPCKYPPKTCLKHGLGLRVCKELRLDKTAQTELFPDLFLSGRNREHEFHHIRVDVKFVVIE